MEEEGLLVAWASRRLGHHGVADSMGPERAAEARGRIVPYTVILRETIHRPDGTRTVVAEQLQAIRSDGSRVVRFTHRGRRETTERVITFASGVRVATDEGARTKSTVLRRGVTPASWLRDPAAQCVRSLAGEPLTEPPEVVQGEEMVAGFRTVKITDGIFTEWLALDCGCAVVRSRADWGSEGYSQWDVVALRVGEPDEALFAVAGYREVPPSERVLGRGESRRSVDAQMLERCVGPTPPIMPIGPSRRDRGSIRLVPLGECSLSNVSAVVAGLFPLWSRQWQQRGWGQFIKAM